MVRSATLLPTSTRLYAANDTEIHVLGWMRLNFKVQGKHLYADLLVSEDVDELMLSCEWLAQNRCHWLFEQGVLEIDGMAVKLKQRPARNCVRRVYVRETLSIPPDTLVNVPVRLPRNSMKVPKCDWLVAPREIKPGLFAARTLLADSDEFAAIRFVNISGKTQCINAGTRLGDAQPGVPLGPLTEETPGRAAAPTAAATGPNGTVGSPVTDGDPEGTWPKSVDGHGPNFSAVAGLRLNIIAFVALFDLLQGHSPRVPHSSHHRAVPAPAHH